MNKFKSLALAVLILVLSFSLCGCSSKANSSTYDLQKSITVSPKKGDKATLYSSAKPREELNRISRSDMTVLYLDESNFGICIYDAGSKKLWRALPENSDKEKPSMLSVTVIRKGKRYILNSQDDSVAQKNAAFELGDNSVAISFSFKKEFDDGAKVDFNIPLVFSAQDGMMSAELDCGLMNKSNKGNTAIESISLLNWFGASNEAQSGDYIFIPDGCGAIIKSKPTPKKFKSISLPVYEKDGAYIPAFGIKAELSAFVALVEQGDAISTINAEKALASGGFNKAYASFQITETKKSDKKITVSGSSYNGKIKVSYRFLSGDTADYVGMASACRELLIRNSVLDLQEQNSDGGALPLNLTLIGAARFAKPGKGNHETTTVLTNPEQAYDMLSYFKSKGIGSINVRYDGIFKGALEQNKRLSLAPTFGSKKKLGELISFTQNQNIRLFSSVNLLSFSKHSLGAKAVGLDSKPLTLTDEKLTSPLVSSTATLAFQRASKLEKNSAKLLSKARKLPFEGICLSDAGSLLYSDSTKNSERSRQQIKDAVTTQVNAFSTSKDLMVSGGNIYALKYAKVVTDLENTAKINSKIASPIPFMQIILHGYTDYSSTAFNLETDSETAFLKAVEYGCVPAYDLYFADYSTDETQDIFSYENYVSQMQTYYDRMSGALSDLRDKKITAHYEVKSGVFCTEYGSATSIYVNYNNTDVTVNGVTVEGRSFIRI